MYENSVLVFVFVLSKNGTNIRYEDSGRTREKPFNTLCFPHFGLFQLILAATEVMQDCSAKRILSINIGSYAVLLLTVVRCFLIQKLHSAFTGG